MGHLPKIRFIHGCAENWAGKLWNFPQHAVQASRESLKLKKSKEAKDGHFRLHSLRNKCSQTLQGPTQEVMR